MTSPLLHLFVSQEMYRQTRRLAHNQNKPISSVVREALSIHLERELGVEYEKKLSQFLTRRTGRNIECPVKSVAVEPFIAVVDEFIEKILKAVPQGD